MEDGYGASDAANITDSLPSQGVETLMEDNPALETALAANEQAISGFMRRFGAALLVVTVQAVLIRLVWRFFHGLDARIVSQGREKFKPLWIKKFRVLNTDQIIRIVLFLSKILKYLITLFQLFITLPIVFSLFPDTREMAHLLWGYILSPLKTILLNALAYIPNLITITIIVTITRYVLRGLKFFAIQIGAGKLGIPGFYADWAWPTFNILRVLLYAFTVAIVFPYLPGSDSKFFQGVSVFVGIIFSLGSSSAVGNVIAGMVITYMRSFKTGDWIKINEQVGTVIEKSPFVIRVRNYKNEYITFPNMTVLNSSIVNYNFSAESPKGLIIHAEITMGYDIPWRQVHEILLQAAAKTPFIEQSPKPFVLQSALNDFYGTYQINAHTRGIDKLPGIYSELYQNIQDGFDAAGISMTAPHYRICVPGDIKKEN